MVRFSFVLLCYNNWSMSEQAICTLIESLDPDHLSEGVEIIIVDNGSTDITPKGIKKIKKKYENNLLKIKTVRLNQNMGYVPGINAGLAETEGDMIGILNNDLIFPPGWFNGVVKALEGDRKLGLAAPYLSSSSGKQNVDKTFSSFEEMKAFADKFIQEGKPSIFTHRVIGACMVFKREVIKLIGGNDFWFGLGQFDDDDWCARTQIAGYKICIVGTSFVQHLSTVTYKQQNSVKKKTYKANKVKIFNKWGVSKKSLLKEALKKIEYNREKHYFPIRIEDYNHIPKTYSTKKKSNKFLFVADWNNSSSEWKKVLKTTIENLNETDELHLWVPHLYFKSLDPLEGMENGKNNIYINREDISPRDLLIYLSSFDNIYPVAEDYVNRYMISLVNHHLK